MEKNEIIMIFEARVLPNIKKVIEEFEDTIDVVELESYESKIYSDTGFQCDYSEQELYEKAVLKLIEYIREDGIYEYFKLDEVDIDTPEMDALQEMTIDYLYDMYKKNRF